MPLSRCPLRRIDARGSRGNVPPHVPPQCAEQRKANRDQQGGRESESEESVVLCAEEFNDESLESGEKAIKTEEPADCMLVIAETPEDQKHDEAHQYFEYLRWVNRNDLRRRHPGRELY